MQEHVVGPQSSKRAKSVGREHILARTCRHLLNTYTQTCRYAGHGSKKGCGDNLPTAELHWWPRWQARLGLEATSVSIDSYQRDGGGGLEVVDLSMLASPLGMGHPQPMEGIPTMSAVVEILQAVQHIDRRHPRGAGLGCLYREGAEVP